MREQDGMKTTLLEKWKSEMGESATAWGRFFLLAALLSTSSLSCKDDHSTGPAEASPELEEAFSLAGQNANLKCLIVWKDGQIVGEKYFHIGDYLSVHDVRSVTKSIMATLIGIAIDKGIIPSEDAPIGNYISSLVDTLEPAKAGITIRQLLSMTSGLEGNDIPDVMEYNNWISAPNQVEYTLGKRRIHQPGSAFGYNTGACHLTSVILTKAAGMSTFQFADQYLFQPLGIEANSWGKDKQGYYNGGAALSLTPQDMLKIGQLYLAKGVHNGVRIVSESWIEKATTSQITTNNILSFGPGYGYLWWVGNTGGHGYFFANGYGGQFIVVVPDLNLVVVATNVWSGVPPATASQQWSSTLTLIMNNIVALYD
jgi:CubicO group peptidase (beta-lactamase class C family)